MIKYLGSKRRLLDTLHRRTGVAMRHIVLEELTGKNAGQDQSFFGSTSPGTGERMRRYALEAPPLALRAVRAALEQAQLAPERITHLVTVSCTGFHAPGVDLALMAALPLRPSVARTHVGFMGCHAALNGLRVAASFTGADPEACVLLCAGGLRGRAGGGAGIRAGAAAMDRQWLLPGARQRRGHVVGD